MQKGRCDISANAYYRREVVINRGWVIWQSNACMYTKDEEKKGAEGGMLSVTRRIVCSTSSDWITYTRVLLFNTPTHTYIQLKYDKRMKENERT
jgi:hypothetical protein